MVTKGKVFDIVLGLAVMGTVGTLISRLRISNGETG